MQKGKKITVTLVVDTNILVQDFVLTDFNVDFRDDASLKRLQGGWTLHALFAKNKVALQPTKVMLLLPLLARLQAVSICIWLNQTIVWLAGAHRFLTAPKDTHHGRRL